MVMDFKVQQITHGGFDLLDARIAEFKNIVAHIAYHVIMLLKAV